MTEKPAELFAESATEEPRVARGAAPALDS
jgi:hypothetical protein